MPLWIVLAVAVTITGVRHYTGMPGCEGYECDWQFQLMSWLVRATAIGLLAACIHAGCAARTVKRSSAGPGTPQPSATVEAFVREALVGLGRADRTANDTLASPFIGGNGGVLHLH